MGCSLVLQSALFRGSENTLNSENYFSLVRIAGNCPMYESRLHQNKI